MTFLRKRRGSHKKSQKQGLNSNTRAVQWNAFQARTIRRIWDFTEDKFFPPKFITFSVPSLGGRAEAARSAACPG